MKVYTNTTFTGMYPAVTSAVVWAINKESASKKLNDVLKDQGFRGDTTPEEMIEFKGNDGVRILNDGDY